MNPDGANAGPEAAGAAASAAAPTPDGLTSLGTTPGEAGVGSSLDGQAPPPAAPGPERVGLYEIVSELGRGGMGSVYKAWHPLRRRHVALKVVRASPASGLTYPRLRELLLREGAILMSLAHENVVACHDANETEKDGKPVLYMALELLEGETLAERLARGPLPPAEALRVARALARALAALHGHPQRVLHRDLKPGNVFLTRDGKVKLLDFGLAATADWRMDFSSYAAGSRPYMAPEQFAGLRQCTERSDLYSLGVTLFEMVAGRTPFQCASDREFQAAHAGESAPALRAVAPAAVRDAPLVAGLGNIAARLLAKRPAERHASAADVLTALERVESGLPVEAPRVTRPESERARRRALRAALAALAILLAAGAGAFAVQGRNGAGPRGAPSPTAGTDAAELARREQARLEAERRAELARVTGLAAVRLAEGDLNMAALAIAVAEDLARSEAEGARVEALAVAVEQGRRLAGVRAELGRGEVEAARDHMAELTREGLAPELAVPAAALQWELAGAAAAAAAATRARRDAALRAVREAEDAGDPAAVRRAVLAARADVPPEDGEGRAALDAALARACEPLCDEALARAAREGQAGGPRAEAAAREALGLLPPAEAAAFRALARDLARDRDALGARAARAALREKLRPHARAERGFLLLEAAVAARDLRAGEVLVARLDGATLGSADPERQNGVHVVSLAPFLIEATEVDARSYAAFVRAGGAAPPAAWRGPEPPAGREREPVRGVSFAEAQAFAARAGDGRRLPLADEWEAAASVLPSAPLGPRQAFPWGPEWLATIAPPGAGEPRPVGSSEADRSPWGALDLGGNVSEWTVEVEAGGREVAVVQGGSFLVGRYPSQFRADRRRRPDISGGTDRFDDTGFRCARDAPLPDLAAFEREP